MIPGQRATLVLRTDGAVEPGPPWLPTPPGARPWIPPSGIEAMDGVILPDGRAVEVGHDGRTELYASGAWHAEDPAPGAPAMLAAAGNVPVLVLRDGRLCTLVGTRWDVRTAALPSP